MKKKDRLFLGLPQSPEHPAPREGGTEKRGEDLHTCTHPWGWGVWPHPPKSIGGYVERGWEPGKASTTYTRQQGALEKWGVQLGNIPLGCGTHPGSVCNIKTPPHVTEHTPQLAPGTPGLSPGRGSHLGCRRWIHLPPLVVLGGFAAFWDCPCPPSVIARGVEGFGGGLVGEAMGQQPDVVTGQVLPEGFGQNIWLKASPSR